MTLFHITAKAFSELPLSLKLTAVTVTILAAILLLSKPLTFEALFLFPILMILPGTVLADILLPSAIPDELLVFGFGLMVAITAVLSLLYTVLPVSYAEVMLTTASLLILAFSLKRIKNPSVRSKVMSADKVGFYFFAIQFVLAASIVLLPVQEGQVPFLLAQPWHTRVAFLPGDMVLPYRVTEFLMAGLNFKSTPFYCCGWQVYDRPPLMGMVAAYLMGTFHVPVSPVPVWAMTQQEMQVSGFPEFWVAGSMLNASVMLSSYLFVKAIFDNKVARLTVAFLVLSPFMLWNTFYTTPKSMAAFFLLVFFYSLIKRRYLPLGAIFAGLGVLSHPYVLIFVAGGFTYFLATRDNSVTQTLKSIAVMMSLLAITVSPWVLWSYSMFGSVPSSLLTTYAEGPTSLLTALWTHIIALYRTITPYFFGYSSAEMPAIFSWNPAIMLQVQLHPILATIALTYIFNLPGALTLTLTVFSYLGFGRLFGSMRNFFIGLVAIPFALSLAVTGSVTSGLTPYFFHPIVVILVATGVWQLLKFRRRIRVLAAIGITFEYLFFVWFVIYPFNLVFHEWFLADYAVFGLILVCFVVVMSQIRNLVQDVPQPVAGTTFEEDGRYER